MKYGVVLYPRHYSHIYGGRAVPYDVHEGLVLTDYIPFLSVETKSLLMETLYLRYSYFAPLHFPFGALNLIQPLLPRSIQKREQALNEFDFEASNTFSTFLSAVVKWNSIRCFKTQTNTVIRYYECLLHPVSLV